MSPLLLYDVPLHPVHDTEHSKPFFRQLRRCVSQSPMHWQRITFNRYSGAGSKSIFFGSIRPSDRCQLVLSVRRSNFTPVAHFGPVSLTTLACHSQTMIDTVSKHCGLASNSKKSHICDPQPSTNTGSR